MADVVGEGVRRLGDGLVLTMHQGGGLGGGQRRGQRALLLHNVRVVVSVHLLALSAPLLLLQLLTLSLALLLALTLHHLLPIFLCKKRTKKSIL